ncbi:hypothetical protein [Halomarina rubra]|uniref:Small CPxCG-related zinc finger protein n=1 Tax=Halomarina rubra TaxID=2071873 RepID=A0ABD6AVX3_9EURY|nr:hypothetical protein [Halomarina rubra]
MQPTWEVRCSDCGFDGEASDESLAEGLSAAHQRATGHSVDWRPKAD